MARFLNSPFGIFVGDFDYRLNASYDQTGRYTYTDPNAAPFVEASSAARSRSQHHT